MLNRRRFLKNILGTVGGLTLASGAGTKAAQAQQGLKNRKHLINILVGGGWDTFWGPGAVRKSEMASLITSKGAIVGANGEFLNPPTGAAGYEGILAAAATTADMPGSNYVYYHERCPDRFLRRHPLMGNQYDLGPAMSDFTNEDLSRTLIWRGILSEGGHGNGNRIIQTGTTGDQTASFPTLVAAATAADYVRPIHYAQLGSPRSIFYNQDGNMVGPAEPIALASLQDWKALTTASADLPAARRRYLASAMDKLSGEMVSSRFPLKSSRDLFSGFLSSFNGAVNLMNSGYADSAEFNNLWNSYEKILTDGFKQHPFFSWFPGYMEYMPSFRRWVYPFALAEFLVKHDLSAVVDVPSPGFDFHTNADGDAICGYVTLTCFRILVKNLYDFQLESGTRLLDMTTVIMHTEFERDMVFGSNLSNLKRPGTGHWDLQTSVLMAGMGVRTGRIIGDFKRGSTSTIYKDSDYSQKPYNPLPMDPESGMPSPSGKIIGVRSIFPTVLSLFNASNLSPIAVTATAGPLKAVMK